jgi:hypothetical protein
MSEEGKSLGVFEANGSIAVTDRPILALLAKSPIF